MQSKQEQAALAAEEGEVATLRQRNADLELQLLSLRSESEEREEALAKVGKVCIRLGWMNGGMIANLRCSWLGTPLEFL